MADRSSFGETKQERLRAAIEFSTRKLSTFRSKRTKAMRQYVGYHYSSEGGSSNRVPINMVWLAVVIYLRQLVPVSPQALVVTAFPDLKPSAIELELALNHVLKEIHYGESLRMVVMDALFTMGISKVGIEVRDVENEMGVDYDAGQPFADYVSFDNWIHDTTATDYRNVAFSGDKYRMPYDFAMEGAGFNKRALQNLNKSSRSNFGENSTDERVQTISQGSSTTVEEYDETVELYDLWLPRDNLMITIPAENATTIGPPLMVKEWEGPENGPYHLLRFNPLPNNILPAAPVQQWMDLSETVNHLWRKLTNQAKRQKDVTLVGPGSEDDGKNVRDADDGDMVRVTNPQGVKVASYGAISQQNMGFAINSRNQLGYMMGNIDSIGGLQAATSTVGQDQLLSQGAGRLVDDLRQVLSAYNEPIYRDLAMYLKEDPYIDIPLVKRPVEGMEVPFNFTQESIEGDFSQYNITIEPFSMRYLTPEERMTMIDKLIMQIALPAQWQFSPAVYAKIFAKYTGLVEIEELFDIPATGQPVDANEDGTPRKMAPQTTRTYERVSRQGPSTQGKQEQMLEQNLFNSNSQQDTSMGQGP